MHFEEDGPAPAAAVDEDEAFAAAVLARQLEKLPPLLPPPTLDECVRSIESCVRATKPRESLLLRTMRRALSCVVHDSGAISRVASTLHSLAARPEESRAADVAAGLLLLIAHGMGEWVPSEPPPPPDGSVVVVMLGFAGGTSADLRKYSSRLYGGEEAELLHVPASEIGEVYAHSLQQVLRRVRSARRWCVHLFSKAGFLMLARLLRLVDRTRTQEERAVAARELRELLPPSAILWDSSPGSFVDYSECCPGPHMVHSHTVHLPL